jgi:hypothetical protein
MGTIWIAWVGMGGHRSLVVVMVWVWVQIWRKMLDYASHYAWGTNGCRECKMDVKSTWIPTWHQMDHVSWSLGFFPKPPLRCRPNTKPGDYGTLNAHNRWFILFYHVWKPTWIKIHWNSIGMRAWSHMTSHYTWGSVTTLLDFGDVLARLSFELHNFMVTALGSCVGWPLQQSVLWCSTISYSCSNHPLFIVQSLVISAVPLPVTNRLLLFSPSIDWYRIPTLKQSPPSHVNLVIFKLTCIKTIASTLVI